MRWVYLIIIGSLATAIIIFAAQNFHVVTVSFLSMSAQMPLALLIVGIYLLGAISGGSLLALIRRSIEGARGA
jgi:putative membrane protein